MPKAKADPVRKSGRKDGFNRSGHRLKPKSAKLMPLSLINFNFLSIHSMNPDRKTAGLRGVSKARDKATIKRLQMYRCSKAKRNSEGKIIRPAPFQSYVMSGTQARIEPSRSWFANSKVIGQNALQKFQDEMKTAMKDPYKVIMRKTRLFDCLYSR